MRLICLVLCAVLASTSAIATGANDVILGQFVHQGLVHDSYHVPVCGLWIHSLRWAIAPAYYMQGRALWNTLAVFGTVSIHQGDHYPVSAIHTHPNFNANTLDNNLAILHIEDGIFWRPWVHPIPLATEVTRGGVMATVAGWTGGEVSAGELKLFRWLSMTSLLFQTQMQYVTQRTLTNEECQARHAPEHRDRITERVICLDNSENVGGCFSHTGAAGSALVSGQFIIGTLSWGDNCTETHYPDVYTRISYYQPWLYSVIGTLELGN